MTVFDALVGQPRAVDALRAAARAPVHAYLLVGPQGAGKRPTAHAFAAALLCPVGGCGTCDVCVRVTGGVHPDVAVVERDGAYISVGQAREIQRLALRTPNEAARKVLILVDFHLVREAAGTLLKIVEEPPPSTVFVILAEHVPPELVTIASRCVRIDFGPVGADQIADALVAEGVDVEVARRAAAAAGGRVDRARLFASDPGFEARREAWISVPSRLDGTGAAVSLLVGELLRLMSDVTTGPLEKRHAEERAAIEERVERVGERGAGRRLLAERQRREVRRVRTDELRAGLALWAARYRDALAAGTADARACLASIEALQWASESIVRNPSESLFLQSLLLRLAPLPANAAPDRSGVARYSTPTPG